jgi:predicted metal-dependent phosphoesterase TrpH
MNTVSMATTSWQFLSVEFLHSARLIDPTVTERRREPRLGRLLAHPATVAAPIAIFSDTGAMKRNIFEGLQCSTVAVPTLRLTDSRVGLIVELPSNAGVHMIDLHVHTSYSDGTLSPRELLRYAADRGIEALAVTDHDTVDGVAEALQEGNEVGVEVVPGVEISAQWESGILHILGYFVRTDHPELIETLAYLKKEREDRNTKILSRLRDLNVHISLDEVNSEAGCGVPGRPHIAGVMARKRYVSTLQEAFDRYLKRGASAYVQKAKLAPIDAMQLIIRADGLPVLAHPHSLGERDPSRLEEIVKGLADQGLQGIEVYYPKHTPDQTRTFLEVTRRFDLAVTGGTDFHGSNKPEIELGIIPGQGPLPSSLLLELKERRGQDAHHDLPSSRALKQSPKAQSSG